MNRELTQSGKRGMIPSSFIDWGYCMVGSIRCSSCKAAMHSSGVCPECSTAKCFIMIYFDGKHHRFWHDKEGDPLSYHKADRLITKMRQEIDDKEFDPFNYILTKIKERQVF